MATIGRDTRFIMEALIRPRAHLSDSPSNNSLLARAILTDNQVGETGRYFRENEFDQPSFINPSEIEKEISNNISRLEKGNKEKQALAQQYKAQLALYIQEIDHYVLEKQQKHDDYSKVYSDYKKLLQHVETSSDEMNRLKEDLKSMHTDITESLGKKHQALIEKLRAFSQLVEIKTRDLSYAGLQGLRPE